MGKRLSFISDSMDVEIKNYRQCKFDYNKWIVSDNYVLNEKNPHLSQYSIVVVSPTIKTEEELDVYRSEGEKVINRIASLIPFCGLPSLNSSKYHSFYDDVSFVNYNESPKGWKTNYNEVKEGLKPPQNTNCTIEVIVDGFRPYSCIGKTPLEDLETMLDDYDSVGEAVKYLVFLNNAILTSSDSNSFMLMGKALEIIDAMYPFRGKTDNRIKDYYPELVDVFDGYTIKEIIGLSNRRKEARHYIKDKLQVLPHESLSKKEAVLLFKCSASLIMNVVRDKFGLTHFTVAYEE